MSSLDAGLNAVAQVREILDPEASRVRDDERGFRWWPHAHAQRIWSEPARADGACIVAAETTLLAGIAGRGPEFARIAFRNAREPGLSALRWNTDTGELSLRAAVIARPNDGDAAARRLSHAALLQIGDALAAADALAVELPGATLATPPPPEGAPREAVAQVEAWRAFAEGAGPLAAAIGAQLAHLADVKPAPWLRVTRAPHGLDAEIPCVPGLSPSAPGEGLALLRLSTTQPHPRMGAGLVVVLVPPPETEPVIERAPATAVLLNEGESREWTGADQLGGWCVHPSVGLAHVTFVPALAIEEDTPEVLAWQAGMRARWALAFAKRVAAMRPGEPPASGN